MDKIIARLAGRAHGVVTRAELLRAGVSCREIQRRLERGVLIRVHPGVYRVGHAAPSIKATFIAAVKACGPSAALSGLAAAYLLGLVARAPARPEVTAPGKRRVRGVLTHRSARIEHTAVKGIRVTTPARTLVDIAGRLDDDQLASACHQAGVRHGLTPRQVEAVLARRPRAPGAGRLRRTMRGDTHVSLSALERRFLRLLRDEGLPPPDHTNRLVGSHRVDCRWVRQRLTVELDSYRYHNSRQAWERDRRREREAYARGDDHRRYTWHDVFEDPRGMLAELRALLTR